jgi:undecaprenyl-diphosphatase
MEFLESIDRGAAPALRVAYLSQLLPVYLALHYLGHPFVVLGVLLLGVLLFLARKELRPALLLICTAAAALGLYLGIQVLVSRPYPNEGWSPYTEIPPTTLNCFPSSHALGATAVYASLGALLARRRGRRWPLFVGVALAFLAGVVQLLLAHAFVSDVLAGWALGALLAMFCFHFDQQPQGATTGATVS